MSPVPFFDRARALLLRSGASWRRAAKLPSSTVRLMGFGSAALVVAILPWRVGVVSGESMTPTMRPGGLFVYETTARGRAPERGDIVLLRVSGQTWVKRVYAVGGEMIWVLETMQDGQRRWEPVYAPHRAYFARLAEGMRRGGAVAAVRGLRIPEGMLFVVGDGTQSFDSRDYGPVFESQIEGRVAWCSDGPLGYLPDSVALQSTVAPAAGAKPRLRNEPAQRPVAE
jgi:signal peptidase I